MDLSFVSVLLKLLLGVSLFIFSLSFMHPLPRSEVAIGYFFLFAHCPVEDVFMVFSNDLPHPGPMN